jgi:hypothetical protein
VLCVKQIDILESPVSSVPSVVKAFDFLARHHESGPSRSQYLNDYYSRRLPQGEYGNFPIDGIAGLLLAYWRNAVPRSSCLSRQNLCRHSEVRCDSLSPEEK